MITLDEIKYEFASIQIKDAAGDALEIGADGSLNVTDNGGSLTVDAVNLDIRDLAFATDKVDVSGSAVDIGNVAGNVTVLQGTSPWVVSATDLDIRNLVFATDKVDVSGSAVDIGNVAGTVTVQATNLDIRDLAFATDKVDVSGSEVSLDAGTLAALENITVSASDLDIRQLNGIYDVGNNPTPDNVGIVAYERGQEPGLAGQTKQLTAANAFNYGSAGDIRALDVNAYMAALNNAQSSIEGLTATNNNLDVHIAGQDAALEMVEGGYGSWSVVAASASTTESQLVAAPLSGRLRVEIQNIGSQDVYIRQVTGVSTSNGLKIPKGSSFEQSLDAGANIFAITGAGTADLRIAQYAA